MSFRRIKTILIILLALVNTALVIFLFSLNSASELDAETVENAVSLLSERGIKVDREEIPRKRQTLPVYGGVMSQNDEEYCLSAAMRLSGEEVTDALALHMMTNGIRIIHTSGDAYEFDPEAMFRFTFRAAGTEYDDESLSALLSEADIPPELAGRAEKAGYILTKWLFGGIDSVAASAFRVTEAATGEGGALVVRGVQTVGDTALEGFGALCVVTDRAVYISGNLTFVSASRSYSEELLDPVAVLFMECSEYIPSVHEDSLPLDIVSCGMAYSFYWNTGRTQFYLIPAWKIEYMGQNARIRNAINGKLYTM